jgi:hypothetical protein
MRKSRKRVGRQSQGREKPGQREASAERSQCREKPVQREARGTAARSQGRTRTRQQGPRH